MSSNQPALLRSTAVPRKIVCRVDVEGDVWVLIKYDGTNAASWEKFQSVKAMKAYISQPKVDLECPQRCPSVEEYNKTVRYVCLSLLTPASYHIVFATLLQIGDAKREIQALKEEIKRYACTLYAFINHMCILCI